MALGGAIAYIDRVDELTLTVQPFDRLLCLQRKKKAWFQMVYNQGSDSKGYNTRDSYGNDINIIVPVSSLFSVQP